MNRARLPMHIRPYTERDLPEWIRMRGTSWPEGDAAEAEADALEWMARDDAVVLVAERPDGGLAGFAELGTRPYADGCETSPVAYLEGWYVDPDVRRSGVGAALVRAAEEWACVRGHHERASDARLENVVSQHAHEALGFEEVERLVVYRKPLRR